jgi:lysozyme
MASGKAKTLMGGGALALAIGIITVFEGTKTTGYLDPVGVATICTGHTGPDVVVGKSVEMEVCDDLLAEDSAWAFEALGRSVPEAMTLPPHTRAAMVSFIFNVGEPKFRSSPIPALLNAGKIKAACEALLPYNSAKKRDKFGNVVIDPKTGKPVLEFLRGLARRREAERKLCLGEAW